jgi:hypothetical protein
MPSKKIAQAGLRFAIATIAFFHTPDAFCGILAGADHDELAGDRCEHNDGSGLERLQ